MRKHLILAALLTLPLPSLADTPAVAYTVDALLADMTAASQRSLALSLDHDTAISRWASTVLPNVVAALNMPAPDWRYGDGLVALELPLGDVTFAPEDDAIRITLPDFNGPLLLGEMDASASASLPLAQAFRFSGATVLVGRSDTAWTITLNVANFHSDIGDLYNRQIGTFTAQDIQIDLTIDAKTGYVSRAHMRAGSATRMIEPWYFADLTTTAQWVDIDLTLSLSTYATLGRLINALETTIQQATVGRYEVTFADEAAGIVQTMTLSNLTYMADGRSLSAVQSLTASRVAWSRNFGEIGIAAGAVSDINLTLIHEPATWAPHYTPPILVFTLAYNDLQVTSVPNGRTVGASIADQSYWTSQFRTLAANVAQSGATGQMAARIAWSHYAGRPQIDVDHIPPMTARLRLSQQTALSTHFDMVPLVLEELVPRMSASPRSPTLHGLLQIMSEPTSRSQFLSDLEPRFPDLDALHAPSEGGARWDRP